MLNYFVRETTHGRCNKAVSHDRQMDILLRRRATVGSTWGTYSVHTCPTPSHVQRRARPPVVQATFGPALSSDASLGSISPHMTSPAEALQPPAFGLSAVPGTMGHADDAAHSHPAAGDSAAASLAPSIPELPQTKQPDPEQPDPELRPQASEAAAAAWATESIGNSDAADAPPVPSAARPDTNQNCAEAGARGKSQDQDQHQDQGASSDRPATGSGPHSGFGYHANNTSLQNPGRGRGRGSGFYPGRRGNNSEPGVPRGPPVYAAAMSGYFLWPRQRPVSERPAFLADFPVPPGKTFNVNSFLGKTDVGGGQYLVPTNRYLGFLEDYYNALMSGCLMFLTENYQTQVYKYFIELDWEWDTDLGLVMEVTPQLLALITRVAGEFYNLQYPNTITSIRTPYKVHVNFPKILTTELLACICRDRILEACRSTFPQYDGVIDWERLVDFPHGSLRLMGSRKKLSMDRDPEWVRDKAYYPARLTDGKWRPGRLSVPLLAAASIFPERSQVQAFERSPAYIDIIFSDMDAYKEKMEERRRRRQSVSPSEGGGRGGPSVQLPPGSSKNPLRVTLRVNPDDTVSLDVHIKSRFRRPGRIAVNSSSLTQSQSEAAEAAAEAAAVVSTPAPTSAGQVQGQEAQQQQPDSGQACTTCAGTYSPQGAPGPTASEEAAAGRLEPHHTGSGSGPGVGVPASAGDVGPRFAGGAASTGGQLREEGLQSRGSLGCSPQGTGQSASQEAGPGLGPSVSGVVGSDGRMLSDAVVVTGGGGGDLSPGRDPGRAPLAEAGAGDAALAGGEVQAEVAESALG